MPNHVECVLRVTGDANTVRQFKELCVGSGPRYVEKPGSANWDDEEPESRVLDFNKLLPVPSGVLARGYSTAGFEWQIANWGTKWNAYGPPYCVEIPHGVAYFFTTAWNTPKGWLSAAAARFPSLRFELWARDEYPWAETILIEPADEEGRCVERCFGEGVADEKISEATIRKHGEG